MSLLTRLTQPQAGEERLPVHEFMASLAEFKRGAPGVNATSIGDAFGLSQAERNQLNNFISNLNANTIDRALIHDVLLLGVGKFYTVNQCASRLGV